MSNRIYCSRLTKFRIKASDLHTANFPQGVDLNDTLVSRRGNPWHKYNEACSVHPVRARYSILKGLDIKKNVSFDTVLLGYGGVGCGEPHFLEFPDSTGSLFNNQKLKTLPRFRTHHEVDI
jgi:hypothetical protein